MLTLETEKKKLDYLSNLFESVYLLDILERHRVKNKSEFEDLVRIVASSIGAPTNTAKLSNTFKSVKKVAISYNTIDKYLGYMQDAFIIEKATRFDITDYKEGVVSIAGIKLSETVFDYLENKGILSKYTYIRSEKIY